MGKSDDSTITLRDDIIDIIKRISKDEKIEDPTLHISEATASGDNYMGKLYRVKSSDKSGKSISMIVKCAPISKKIRKSFPIRDIFINEITTYSEILPAFDALQDEFDIPKKDRFGYAKYYESIIEVEQECVILDDLSVEGYKMYNRQKCFDNQHLEFFMRTLARLHAISFVMKKNKPELFDKFGQKVSKPLEFGGSESLLELSKKNCVRAIENEEIRKKIDDYAKNPLEAYRHYTDYKRTEPYNVICHGDCWINNFLFKYDNDDILDLKFVDWQVVRLSSPITDIAYMMFSSTDEKIRSDYYVKSLDLYYETLDKNIELMGCKLSECYPREVFEDHIKSTMPFGLISSMMLIPIILSEGDDNESKTKFTIENYNEESLDKLLSKSCRERINGIVNDFISYGLI